MSFNLRPHAIAAVIVALCAMAIPARAVTIPLVTSGNNGPTGTRSDTWSNIVVPTNVTITCYVQLSSPNAGGGGAANVTRSGTLVVGCYVNLPGPGTKSDSYTVTGQPAGAYTVSHGFGGPPNSVNAYMQTTISW